MMLSNRQRYILLIQPFFKQYMPTAYQKDGSIFKKLQELFLKSQGLFNEELSSVLITKKQELTR